MQSILTTAYLQSGMCSSQTLFTHSSSSTPSHPNGIIHYSPELQIHIEDVLTKQGGYARFCIFMLGVETSSSAEFAKYKSEIQAFFQGTARSESELLPPWHLVLSRALKQLLTSSEEDILLLPDTRSIAHLS